MADELTLKLLTTVGETGAEQSFTAIDLLQSFVFDGQPIRLYKQTKAYTKGTKVILPSNLSTTPDVYVYEANVNIPANEAFNLTKWRASNIDTHLTDTVGVLSSLTTTQKTTVVAAINSLVADVGANFTNAKAYTDTKISELINGSGSALDTLKELANALNNDPNFASTMTTEIAKKLDITTFNTHNNDTVKHTNATEKAFWNAKASTAVATQAANGLMSAADKTAVDNGQKWKLTENSGLVKPIPNNNPDVLLESGMYSVTAATQNVPHNYGVIFVFSRGAGSITQLLQTVGGNSSIFIRNINGGTVFPWVKLADENVLTKALMGDKITSSTTANFVGKISASTTENPHKGFYAARGTIVAPDHAAFTEFSEAYSTTVYSHLYSRDGSLSIASSSSSTVMAMHLFSFDVVQQIERAYGAIPGAQTLAEKIAWVKKNVTRLSFNWFGHASNGSNANATIVRWRSDNSSWYSPTVESATDVNQITLLGNNADVNVQIDSQGFVHFIAHAQPSDGVSSSTIRTDYVDLVIDVTTDIKSSVLLQGVQGYKLTQDDGNAILPPNDTNFDTIVDAGIYTFTKDSPSSHYPSPTSASYWIVDVKRSGSGTVQTWHEKFGTAIFHRSNSNGVWTDFIKLTNDNTLVKGIMGNDIIDKITATFNKKVAGSVVENPHDIKVSAAASILAPEAHVTEVVQDRYTKTVKLDGQKWDSSNATNGNRIQVLFSFDAVAFIEQTYGTIPAISLAKKIDWVKENVSQITFNWWGHGSAGAGNKAYVSIWSKSSNAWQNTVNHVSSTVTKLTVALPVNTTTSVFNTNGVVYYGVYTDAASATIPAVLSTDFADFSIEVSTSVLDTLTSKPISGKIELATQAGVTNITLNGENGQIDAKAVNINGVAGETTTGAQTKATTALNSAKSYTDTTVGAVVDTAPLALNTLKKLAASINNDANFYTTMTTALAGKANSSHTHAATDIIQTASYRFATDTEKALWNAKASTAVATQSANGLMSAADKIAVDNGQQWKLTANDGRAITKASGTDLNTLTESGTFMTSTQVNAPIPGIDRWYFVEVMRHNALFVSQRATNFAAGNSVSFIRTLDNNVWLPWKRISDDTSTLSIMLGNKIPSMQSYANFIGKTAGNTTTNPHLIGRRGTEASLISPSSGLWVEPTDDVSNIGYPFVNSPDGNTLGVVTTTLNAMAQVKFSFNLIEHVQKLYGTIPGATTTDKVNWLKANLTKTTLNWHGFGTGANAGALRNWAKIHWWAGTYWSLIWEVSTSVPSKASPSFTGSSLLNNIDSSGFAHFLVSADPSNGTISSSINTDFVELIVELTTDLKTNLELQGMQGHKLTKDDGNVLATPNNNLNDIMDTGYYYCDGDTKNQPGSVTFGIVHHVARHDANHIQTFVQNGTGQTYTRVYMFNAWTPWKQSAEVSALIAMLSGSTSFFTTVNTNFEGKVVGTNTPVPHVFKRLTGTTLRIPTDSWVENALADYNQISKQDGSSFLSSTTSASAMAQQMFSFDIVKIVESHMGPIPASSLANKIAWLRKNLSVFTVNWWGYGKNNAGNRANLTRWNAETNEWLSVLTTGAYNTSASSTKVTFQPSHLNSIDASGMVHILAYAEASNGTVASELATDFIELNFNIVSNAQSLIASSAFKEDMFFQTDAGAETVRINHETGRVDAKSVFINNVSAETTTGAQAKATTAETNAKAYTDTKVAALVDTAPGTLDTLNELAQALGDDPNFATTVSNQIAGKANLVHTHAATDITQTASYRFASDTEKATWNAKETPSGAQSKATTAETNAKAYADTKSAAIVDGAPTALDTLKKIALSLNNDPAINTTLRAYTDSKSSEVQANVVSYVDGKTSIMLKDTRTVDSPPSYYMPPPASGTSEFGKKVNFEFKAKTTVGLSSATGNFVLLQTIAKWNDTSGGAPIQIAYDDAGTTFVRSRTSDTTWSSWVTMETTDGAQSKATTALTSAKSYTDTSVANVLASTPVSLNTLQKIAAAINNDPAFFTTITNLINGKANSSHTHATGDITTTASARFVSDTEKSTWNSKANSTTSVLAGTGLTGGGTLAADRTLSVNFAGTGSAGTVSRSDHTHALTNLTDVTVTSPVTGHTLRYNGSSWVNAFPTMNDNSDITLASVVSGNILQHNGTNWVNRSLVDAGIAASARNITAGSGLTGGGNLTADRTLSVNFAGTGSATTVARSDHNHDTAYLKLTGGTITGDLAVSNTVKAKQIEVESSTSAKKFRIEYNETEDSLDFIIE